ncbi:glycoside hydrolase family 78 protein [Paenibacillus sp. p3-SID867]|uniref:glycoside hydrolase family 78 protein n=1 Tax=Paenibacillus sp. p3-SID867 TaxID=2916363 RepID=UPI0021A34B28|nr:glycoside hydrolase family 78 protein [Paenibacillus sp. p3-SID867]MCT1399959.1 glycoside hydrolase family 78 protein [Paenibacillus sp. p3-SID867]
MLTIQKPLVHGLENPLGLDVSSPRFSWLLESDRRGESCAAYRVRVSLSAEGLSNRDLVWDSGRRSGQSLSLLYDGPPLQSNTRYWWRVTVWDRQGKESESVPAYWDTGLFPGDWSAEWIWRSEEMKLNDFAYFRKSFDLRGAIARAKIFVSAHHVFQLFVNGQRVGGYGSPAPTGVPHRKYYLAYDVAPLLLSGANCIGIAAHYLGGSGQNYVNGVPGMLLQLHVEHEDGTEQLVVSDLTWQALRQIPHRIGSPYQQNRRLSAIEDYDAALLEPNWLQPDFGEEHCTSVVLAHPSVQPWSLHWQRLPEAEELESIIPSVAAEPSFVNGEEGLIQVFDAGKIISGWPQLALPGMAGVIVRLRYAETLDGSGRVVHQVCNETSHHYYDLYTMHGRGGIEYWQPDFSFKAFRYVEVTGYPLPIEEGQLRICSAGTAMARTGHFRCSSEFLNKLYDVCLQTQRNNVLGQVVDCPHREQAQYLADTDLQAETLLYNFDAYPVLDKTLQDFADGQLEDGTFPFVFPSNYEHPDFFIQIPEWDLHYATLLWKLYQFSGDTQVLSRYYEPMRAMVDAYLSLISPVTGLIPVGRGWHISDWPYPTVEHEGEHLTVQQIKAWQALRILSEAAALLNRADDSAAYAAHAQKLQVSVLNGLYDGSGKLLHDSSGSTATHQGVNALALYAGLLPTKDREAALKAVAGKPWESKTVLSLPLLRLLFEEGLQDQAYHLLSKPDYPGWGYMIAQGAETMWEGWDDIESHCHAWNGYPARLLQEYVCGIQSGAPGFATARIRPFFALDLDFAEASVSTVRGKIAVRWERVSEAGIRMRLELPCTMSATAALASPSSRPITSLLVDGVEIWGGSASSCMPDGIVRCERDDSMLELELLSGRYELTVRY